MAQPVFLSYSWDDIDAVDVVDELLRWRGVPVWRDRRAMGFGQYQEDEVRRALREDCSGFALYLTEAALQSSFVAGIELPEMDSRRAHDDRFFAGAMFCDWGFEDSQQKVHERCGVVLSAALGERVDASAPLSEQLTQTANSILATYLARQRPVGPAEILLDTRADIPWRADGLLHLAWSPPLAHRLDDHDPGCWQRDLLPALHDTRIALENANGDRALRVRGRAHLSAALALGHEFRLPTQWAMEIRDQSGAAWTASAAKPDLQGWQADARPGPTRDGGVLVCAINASQDIARYVRLHRTTLPVARATMNICPPNGAGGQSVDPQTANVLAAGIADRIRSARNEYGTTETHLYLACPWPLAALLGWHLSSSGAIVSFEATEDRSSYVRACRLT